MRNLHTTLALFVILLFTAIFGFGIFTDGMFFDGIRYANVARNYAEGFGSFWKLYYGNSSFTTYHDQPPFTFLLQAQFFKIFGTSVYTERIYTAVFAIIHFILIKELWQELAQSSKRFYWLPVLFWIIVPLSSWTFSNNMQEVTMGAFDLASVIFIMKGCRQNNAVYLLSGGILVLLASLCKGLQGLFPIAIPLFYWMIYRERSMAQIFSQSLIVVSVILVTYCYFYITPEIRESIGLYFKQRLEATFNHVHDTKKSHLYLLYKLFLELLAPIVITTLLWVLNRTKRIEQTHTNSILLMILVGISSSFPLMITLEQRAFYLTTSLPYYVTAIALIALPYIRSIEFKNIKPVYNALLLVQILITVVAIGLNAKNPKRDHDLLHDLYRIRKHIPEGEVVSIPERLSTNWAYHAYFMRYGKITLDHTQIHRYLIAEKDYGTPTDSCYREMGLDLKRFSVFECVIK